MLSRDAMGNVLEIITKESISPLMLDEDVRELLTDPEDRNQKNYHYTKAVKKGCKVYQEIQDILIPKSVGKYKDENNFIPLRFTELMVKIMEEDL